MRSIFVFILLSLTYFSSTGADFIDSQTKKNVQELNVKYDKLLKQEMAHHEETIQFLKGLQEMVARKTTVQVITPPKAKSESVKSEAALPSPETQTAAVPIVPTAVVTAPSVVTTPTSLVASHPVLAPKIEPVPMTTAPLATPAPSLPVPATGSSITPLSQTSVVSTAPASPLTVSSPPSKVVPFPSAPLPPIHPFPQETPKSIAPKPNPKHETTPIVQVTIPKEVLAKLESSQSSSRWALFVSIISLVGLVLLVVSVKKQEERLRKIVWKSEMDTLKSDMSAGRPQLKVENSYDRLLLTNIGTVTADEIKLSLGPAPTTMQQKLRIMSKIQANEKAEVEIGAQVGGQLYGKLEYKNPQNGKIFKDQFVVKVDGVTGEFVPIQQAC